MTTTSLPTLTRANGHFNYPLAYNPQQNYQNTGVLVFVRRRDGQYELRTLGSRWHGRRARKCRRIGTTSHRRRRKMVQPSNEDEEAEPYSSDPTSEESTPDDVDEMATVMPVEEDSYHVHPGAVGNTGVVISGSKEVAMTVHSPQVVHTIPHVTHAPLPPRGESRWTSELYQEADKLEVATTSSRGGSNATLIALIVVVSVIVLCGIIAAIAVPIALTTQVGTAIIVNSNTTTTVTIIPQSTSSPLGSCGRAAVDPIIAKIVGGIVARPYSWPWLVVVRIYTLSSDAAYSATCDGALISNQWVITAAHCTSKGAKIHVLLGVHDISQPQFEIEASSFYTHEGYNLAGTANDIGAIKLSKNVSFSNTIQPICLPSLRQVVVPGNDYYVAGWGATVSGGSGSQVLLQVQLPVIDDYQCATVYSEYQGDSELCAAWPQGQMAPCQGDSGGPLMKRQTDGSWAAVGLVSYAEGCAIQGKPDVFTDVAYFRPWIDSTILK